MRPQPCPQSRSYEELQNARNCYQLSYPHALALCRAAKSPSTKPGQMEGEMNGELCGACKNTLHLNSRPFTAACRGDAGLVQRRRNLTKSCRALRLCVPDGRE